MTDSGVNEAYRDHDDLPPDWHHRRQTVLKRDNFRCQYCLLRSTRDDDIVLDIDHIIPRYAGGNHDLDNLRALCPNCHASRHGDIEELHVRAAEWNRRNDTSIVGQVAKRIGNRLKPGTTEAVSVTDPDNRSLMIEPLTAVETNPLDSSITLTATVKTLWDSSSDAIKQQGILKPDRRQLDEDIPEVPFVIWSDSDLCRVHPYETYCIIGGNIAEYQGDRQLQLDERSEIKIADRWVS